MNKISLALMTLALSLTARAQSEVSALSARSFDAQAEQAIASFLPVDAFAGVGACGVLDVKTLRPWTLDEASTMAAPCLSAVGSKYQARMTLQTGLVSGAVAGHPAKPGLLLKTDLVPGSKAHRDLIDALALRNETLLGHPVRLLVRGQADVAAVSPVQNALSSCPTASVVRDLNSSEDFIKIYGSCLTRNAQFQIALIQPGDDMTVTLMTEQAPVAAASLNGYVTVNAGAGPVRFMILAESVRVTASVN